MQRPARVSRPCRFPMRKSPWRKLSPRESFRPRKADAPPRSYWNGCSTGGRQALKEAQMFPDDFDGIIAGAPGNRTAMAVWIAHALLKDPAAHIPPAKYPLIHKAALAACDAADGLQDGL